MVPQKQGFVYAGTYRFLRRNLSQIYESKLVSLIATVGMFMPSEPTSLQGIGLQAGIALSRSPFGPVLAHPRIPALACRRIATGKRECRYVGIGDFDPLAGILRQHPDKR